MINKMKIINPVVLPFESEEFKEAWEMWKEYKKEVWHFTFKSHLSEQAMLRKLSRMAEGDEEECLNIIEYSMGNQWQGLFKERKNDTNYGASNFERQRKDIEDYRDELLEDLQS